MKLTFTKRGRDQAVSQRTALEAEPGEQYRAMVALASRVPGFVSVVIGLAVLFLIYNPSSHRPVVGLLVIFGFVVIANITFPYRSLVATDRRLLVYRARPFNAEPGDLLMSVSRAGVQVRAVHAGWLRPFVLEVNGQDMKFYTYSISYWQDARALCQALGSNAEQSAA